MLVTTAKEIIIHAIHLIICCSGKINKMSVKTVIIYEWSRIIVNDSSVTLIKAQNSNASTCMKLGHICSFYTKY